LFLPGGYTLQVFLNSNTNVTVNYEITAIYNKIKPIYDNDKKNLFVGFWESNTRGNRNSLLIKEHVDGSLYYINYRGNNIDGFQPSNIQFSRSIPGAFFLEKIKGGYRQFINSLNNTTRYYYLNNFEPNQLLSFTGGVANPMNITENIIIYMRLDNPKFVDYLSSNIVSTPTSLFENYFNTAFYELNPQFNRAAESKDFPGINKMIEYKNELLSNNIIEEFEGTDIWPEMTAFNDAPEEVFNLGVTKVYEGRNITGSVGSTTSTGFYLFLIFPPNNDFILGFVYEISNVKAIYSKDRPNANPIDFPNGLYELSNKIILPNGDEQVFFTSLFYAQEQRGLFVDNISIPKITVTPRVFQVLTTSNVNINSVRNVFNASIIKLENLPNIGNVSSTVLNGKHTVYRTFLTTINGISRRVLYIFFPKGVVSNETIFIEKPNGIIRVSSYPVNNFNARLYNINTITGFPTPLTYFFTTKPTLSNPYSYFEIKGLTGEYSRLNGFHDAHPSSNELFNSNNNEEIWGNDYYYPNRKYFTAIKVDTDGLPSYDPKVHGKFTLRKIVNRVTDNINYGDFADACLYLFKKMGVNTHGVNEFYYDVNEGSRNPTWKQIQTQLTKTTISPNLNTIFTINFNRERDTVGSTVQYQGFNRSSFWMINELNKNCYGNVPGNPIDSSLRLDLTSANILTSGNIANHYLNLDQMFYTYATISGPVLNERVPGSDPDNKNISNDLIDLGYNANGTVISYQTLNNFVTNIRLDVSINQELPTRYYLENSFSINEALLGNFEGDIILANPPLATTNPLINAEDCAGKIVVVIRGEIGIGTKYNIARNAGAIAVIIINNAPGNLGNFNLGVTVTVPVYSLDGTKGNQLTGYNGGDINDPDNYTLSTTSPTNYTGIASPTPVEERLVLVGGNRFRFGLIDSKFTIENNIQKNIGYIFLPNNFQLTPYDLELNPVFYDVYKESTFTDLQAKMWAVIMSTFVTVPDNKETKQIRFSELDSIIIDNSNNIGGYQESILALSSFFGENRPNISFINSYKGVGFAYPSTIEETSNNFPPSKDTIFKNITSEIPCDKYQELYPEAKFKGKKVIVLTSTEALSSGDIVPHYFRNTKAANYRDLGNNITSTFIGTIDGRIQGSSQATPLTHTLTKDSVITIAPDVGNITTPVQAYQIRGESNNYGYNTYTQESLCSQLSEIKIDGLSNSGPISAWREDEAGTYQAFGFSSTYLRDNEQYSRFNKIIGLPQAYNSSTYHYPWLEDAILASLK